jgi:hypothetical protein
VLRVVLIKDHRVRRICAGDDNSSAIGNSGSEFNARFSARNHSH